jgi:glycosyltransferase involved in cell wall biosynthesis
VSTSEPVLSVLLPVKAYHERFLREAVDSVLAQTAANWRLLLVCDAPLRPELERVLGERGADPRIDFAANEGRQLAGKLNTGMRRADTEYVAILLGDDLWDPRAVEVLSRAIDASPETDFFHSSRRFVDEHGRPISSVYRARPFDLADFLTSAPVKHLLCWRRETGLAIGGMDESLNSVGVDDFDFPWSMAEAGAAFTAVDECLYVARDHRESFRLTTHLPRSHHKRELARIMRKHGADRATIAARVAAAERSYLRQCLYRSRLDRWAQVVWRRDPRRGARELFR